MLNIFLHGCFFLCHLEHRSHLSWLYTFFVCNFMSFFFPPRLRSLPTDLAWGGRLLCRSYIHGWIVVTLDWKGSAQLLAPGVVFGHLVLYISGKRLNSELYMMGRGWPWRGSSILWNCVFNCRSRGAKKTKQSHQLPGLCLCSVFFASCNKLKKRKKIFSVLIFRSLYVFLIFVCFFDFWSSCSSSGKK